MIIGIDIGSTATKAVSLEPAAAGPVIHTVKTKAQDAVTAAAGALGKLMAEHRITIAQIERIMVTGAGASLVKADLFGIPTRGVDEITAVGVGGMFLSGKQNIVITNIGTGTIFIEARQDRITHLGGSGVGGGTILGLAKKLLGISDFPEIMRLAQAGDIGQVDLMMRDIMDQDLSFLMPEATAANFGKMLDTARSEDLALGIINLVYQVIGVLSVFAARSTGLDRVIVTGNGSDNPVGKAILELITKLYAVPFEYPADAAYTTAIGASLAGAPL